MSKHYVNCIDCDIKVDIEEDSSCLMHYCSRCNRLRIAEARVRELEGVVEGRVEFMLSFKRWVESEDLCGGDRFDDMLAEYDKLMAPPLTRDAASDD